MRHDRSTEVRNHGIKRAKNRGVASRWSRGGKLLLSHPYPPNPPLTILLGMESMNSFEFRRTGQRHLIVGYNGVEAPRGGGIAYRIPPRPHASVYRVSATRLTATYPRAAGPFSEHDTRHLTPVTCQRLSHSPRRQSGVEAPRRPTGSFGRTFRMLMQGTRL
ncbi:hypothetical protein J6590_100514 [Homalodisca vitripennis]|nr:hypothetical protein J6590_100514 [Homalodisca vitripennis]